MGIFTDPPLEPWERARADAYQALERAERLHNATMRMLERIQQAAITHHEVDHSENAARRPSVEEIENDERRREEERRHARNAILGQETRKLITMLDKALKGK
jgi:hypothetical protein